MFSRKARLSVACSGLVSCLCFPGLAHAQNATVTEPVDTASAEIIVTAQRRAQSMQDVPIAISAIGADTLEDRGIVSLVDLQGVVPGLNISGSSGANGSNMVSIRGIVAQPVPLGTSQPTAVYLDGVYLPKPDSAFFGLQDVERIEVLRGPQGTLYGRNATAGAINIITRTSTDQLEGKLDASYGNFNTISVGGYMMGGLADHLTASISGSYNDRDGYYTNIATDRTAGDADHWTVRGKLRYQNDKTDISLIGDISRKKFQDVWHRYDANGNLQLPSELVSLNLPADDNRTIIDSSGLAMTANFELTDHLTLTSISSLRDYRQLSAYDVDGTATATVHVFGLLNVDTANQEVRANYSNGALRLIMGANYYHEKGSLWFRVNPSQFTTSYLKQNANPLSTTSVTAWAAFVQAEYDILPSLTLVAGARYNDESRDFTIDYSAVGPFTPINGSVSDNTILPSAGINFHPSGDLLIYAKASQGYQSPGFAYSPGAGVAANTFGPEKLWAYEAGVKSILLDGRLILNAAGFYYDYTDIQVRQLVSPGVTQIANAGAASVRGVEADITFHPVRDLTLTAQATYAKATIDSFCEALSPNTLQGNDPLCVGTPSVAADRSGNRLAQAPRFSGGVSATYSIPLTDTRRLTLSATYAWESNIYYTAANLPELSSGGWNIVNARAELKFSDRFSIYVYGRNLTDGRYVSNAFYLGGAFPGTVQLNAPRTYGAGMLVHF